MKTISPFNRHRIVMLSVALLIGCAQPGEQLRVLWSGKAATGLHIAESLIEKVPDDSVQALVKVRLGSAKSDGSMLGSYSFRRDAIVFSPVVPFTRGESYQVVVRNDVIGTVEIPLDDSIPAPSVLEVYPSGDTVPENLLKMYVKFSQPMAEGRSLHHINVLQGTDTMAATFLDLQPELWNEDATVLTLWLDPGRIKRDLIPNKVLGIPIRRGNTYTLTIDPAWKSKGGRALAKGHSKSFFVAVRDEQSPDPDMWELSVPQQATTQPLGINFGEPLDHSLPQQTIRIVDADGIPVSGRLEVLPAERSARFLADAPWSRGKYSLKVDRRLEDLSGNNISRLFDTDMGKPGNDGDAGTVFQRSFQIK